MPRLNLWLIVAAVTALMALATLPAMWVAGQADTGVYAEALIRANLRAQGDINADVVGEIANGTRYPVIGRNEFAVSTWYLLGDPATFQPLGWVYFEVVEVYGNINVVPFATLNINTPPTSTSTPPAAQAAPSDVPPNPNQPSLTPSVTPSPTPQLAVAGLVSGEINLRYGPGVQYERVGIAQSGSQLEIIGYHTQFDWVLVRFPEAPNGEAWVASNLLDIQGDVFTTRAISRTDYSNLPTLTPTQAVVQPSDLNLRNEPVTLSPGFVNLGNNLWNQVLSADFDPATSRFGGLYILDLQTGESLTFGSQYAFSGTSLNKIAIILTAFGILEFDPDPALATDMANMMICSGPVASNAVLNFIGGGDLYAGAEATSSTLLRLGLPSTFITAPYQVPNATAIPPVRPIRYPDTEVDQQKANPNLTNQMTVDELGYLLGIIYECGYNESGPLLEDFDTFTPQECRKVLHVMSNNNVDGLLKAGVPSNITVAHKHGWVNDTHGNAALFFTPGGDYVIAIMMYQPEWLNFQESLPVMAEISRTVYNAYNPDIPLDTIRDGSIPEATTCNFAGTQLIDELVSPGFLATLP